MNDSTQLHGIVHGNTIELNQDAGFADGQQVTVTLRPVVQKDAALEGLRRSFGAWAEDAEEVDAYLEWNRQQRKQSRPEIEP